MFAEKDSKPKPGASTRQGEPVRKNLYAASLVDADLSGQNLARVNLRHANLRGANLTYANLIGANLTCAHMDGVTLVLAHLHGADLTGATLKGANLYGVHCDEDTILPDGSNWSEDTDFARFTDPDHPDFWSHK